MQIDWEEFNRGVESMRKEAGWLGDTWNNISAVTSAASPGSWIRHPFDTAAGTFRPAANLVSSIVTPRLDGLIDAGINKLTGFAGKVLPILGAFSGFGKGAPGAGATPPIQLNLGAPKNMLTPNFGEVHSVMNPKIGGLIDPNMVRSVLTARAVNGITDTLKPQGSPEQPTVDGTRLKIQSKYPEMQKLLADPETRAYLESLLKADSTNG
jgi:hypothetical protein